MEKFPNEIIHFIENMPINKISIGLSNDNVYEVVGINNYIIKTSPNIERLEREKTIFEWLFKNDLLPVPEVIFWLKTNKKGYLITKKIRGKMALNPFYLRQPIKLAKILNEAIEMISKVPLDKYPYPEEIKKEKKYVFSHGDLCLPNIILRNNHIVGFVDMGESGIEEKWYDVATCLRSYEFNLKSKKHSQDFLNVLIKPDIKRIMEFYPVVFS